MLQKGYFFTQNFFSKALRKFSVRRMTTFNISGRLSKIISLRSKKNQSHTTHQTDYMSGNVAKAVILKIHFQNRVGEVQTYASKCYFFKWIFFSKVLRKFSTRRMTMFNISGRLSKIISLHSKKNQSHTRHQLKDINENPVHISKKPGSGILPFVPL